MRIVAPDKAEGRNHFRFAALVLPWLLAGFMAGVYLLTLNPWVAPESLALVANVSGLNPRVELFKPVTYLATWPFRWLPLAWIPPALNLMSAACAALSLAWLARSVALLPHDRTHNQRLRLREGTPWLTLRQAWLPPTLAVLLCGWQLTFWEHAIAATGEMFDLLLFAYLVRSLLELRADGHNARLPRFALVYGLAVANNWAMAGFAPLFLLAAVWAARANPFKVSLLHEALKGFKDRKVSFFTRFRQALAPFNPGLWVRSVGCFLAGLALLLLLPLVAGMEDNAQVDFGTALHSTLRLYKRLLLGGLSSTVLLLCLGSVLPALFMTICWGRFARGATAGEKLAAGMFHGLHAFFLVVCLWVALDLPLSPRRLGTGFACLPLYYLGALSAGYFSGYLLLVFGNTPRPAWQRTRLLARVVNLALTVAVWAVLVGVPGLLLYQSLPYILWTRTGALASLATQLERCLPPPGAVILADGSFDLLCLQTTLIRRGQESAYLPIDVSSLVRNSGYFDFLRRRHPEFKLSPPLLHLRSDLTNPPVLRSWIENLAAGREVYYLHPFHGLLAESFASQPRGLLYQLKPCPANVLEEGPLGSEALADNRAFWQAFIAGPLPELASHIPTPEQLAQSPAWQWLHLKTERGPERDPWAAVVGSFYSRALNIWGVELQKAGLLSEAGDCFAVALQLSPDNVAALLNRDFHHDLQTQKPAALQPAPQIEARLGKRHSWSQVLVLDGAIDEPSARYQAGVMLAKVNLPRQAARQFARAHSLAPGEPDIALRLAEQLIRLGDYTNALAAADQVLKLKPLDPDAIYWKGCSLVLLKDYEGALPLLNQSLSSKTNSRTAMTLGFAQAQLGNLDAARQAYEHAAQSPGNAYESYLCLAQVAYLQQDTNAAIRYIELCRSNAPPNPLYAQLLSNILPGLRGPTAGVSAP